MIKKNEKLVVPTTNKNGEIFSIPTKQRALVLQGGGALGCYEIGVLQSICEHLYYNTKSKDENKELEEGGNLNVSNVKNPDQLNNTNDNINSDLKGGQFFDIIAGVSIGAINAVFFGRLCFKKQW